MRTLGAELPHELALALGAPGETPAPADVEELARRVRASAPAHADEARLRARPSRRGAARARVASLVLAFSLGAAAGVAVFTAALVIERGRTSELTYRGPRAVTPPRTPSVRPVAPPPRSAVPDRVPDTPTSPPPRRSTEPSRPPPPISELELPSAAPGGSHAVNQEELALLTRAQAALEGEPGRALALTEEHARRFSQGALVQEREVVAINALLRLGRRAEAAARAARFSRQFPASVHSRRLDVLLGTGGSSGRDHN